MFSKEELAKQLMEADLEFQNLVNSHEQNKSVQASQTVRKKSAEPKAPRERNSDSSLSSVGMVSFQNKKGETIIGPGTSYMVVRSGGMLHYKIKHECIFLPEGYKPGDPILDREPAPAPAPAPAPQTDMIEDDLLN